MTPITWIWIVLVVYGLALTFFSGGVICNGLKLRELEAELDRKADRKKPRPQAKRVPTRTVAAGMSAVGPPAPAMHLCEHCNEEVPERGHTVKQCEGFKFAEMRREQDAEAGEAATGNELGRPTDPAHEE